MSEQAPRSGGGGWVLAFIGAILGATVCFIGAAASASALGRPHRASTLVLSLLAAAFAIASIVLVRLAIHLEHGLRSSAATLHNATSGSPVKATRHPKNGPASRVFSAVLVVGLLVFLVLISVQLHAKANRSAFTQHHGTSQTGTVAAVHKVQHSSRYSSYDTYDYDVALSTPADGVSRTRAHDPSKDFQAFSAGQPITVLVDPKQPGYAELPGQPVQSSRWFIGPLLVAVVFLGLGVLLGHEELRHRRRPASHGAPSAAQAAAG